MTRLGWTVIGVAFVVIVLLWLQFGGTITSWSSGVYSAVRGNREAEAKLTETLSELQKSKAHTQEVLADYDKAQTAVRVLSRQMTEFKQKADQAVALARQKDATIATLQDSLRKSENERRAQKPVTSLEEAKRVLESLHPAYR